MANRLSWKQLRRCKSRGSIPMLSANWKQLRRCKSYRGPDDRSRCQDADKFTSSAFDSYALR